MILITCVICGKEFYVPNRRKDTARCCSEKCKGVKYQHKIVIGAKYGMLTILNEIEPIRDAWANKRMVLCKCDCGNTTETLLSSVRHGNTTSCGCWKLKKNRECRNRLTHGLSNHPLYNVWLSIKNRCYRKNDSGYRFYGARGVKMCDEWLKSFKTFYDWAKGNGWAKGLHLDKDKLAPGRIGKLYCPQFCCYLTPKENGRCTRWAKLNLEKAEDIRRLHATGSYKSKELAEMYEVSPTTISAVLCRRNWV